MGLWGGVATPNQIRTFILPSWLLPLWPNRLTPRDRVWERAKRERADCFRRTVVILSSRYLSVRSFHPARSIMSGSVSLCSPSPSIPSRAGGTEVRWQGTEVNWWLGPTSHVLRSPSSSITSVLCHAFSTPPLLLTFILVPGSPRLRRLRRRERWTGRGWTRRRWEAKRDGTRWEENWKTDRAVSMSLRFPHTRLFPRHFVPPGRHFLAPYGSLVIYSQSSLRSSACGAYGWSEWTVWTDLRDVREAGRSLTSRSRFLSLVPFRPEGGMGERNEEWRGGVKDRRR